MGMLFVIGGLCVAIAAGVSLAIVLARTRENYSDRLRFWVAAALSTLVLLLSPGSWALAFVVPEPVWELGIPPMLGVAVLSVVGGLACSVLALAIRRRRPRPGDDGARTGPQ